MDSFKDTVAFWTSVVGTLVGLVGVLQSLTWVTAFGGIVAIGSIGTLAYAQRQRERIESAALKVAGRSVDSLNMASLRRRVNRSLLIQEAHNTAVIDGENLKISWECAGYCRTERETSIEFSIDSDNNIPFDELDCFAYDLEHDPQRRHRIRPILVGPDGISKKIAVPFLKPLGSREAFHVIVTCDLPGCMKVGIDYYTASISFAQSEPLVCSVRLVFLHARPDWLRAYEPSTAGSMRLLKELRPTMVLKDRAEYLDSERRCSPSLIRVYVFSRSRPLVLRPYSGDRVAI